MSQWVKFTSVDDFQGPVELFTYEEKRIAVVKKGGQEIYAIDDICSHATAFLSEGEVEGYEIECPRHGARFDIRTGKQLCFPAVSPVASYPIKIEEGMIYIDLSEE